MQAKEEWLKPALRQAYLRIHPYFLLLQGPYSFSRQIEVVKKNSLQFREFEGIMDPRERRKYGAIGNMGHHPDYHSQYYVMKMNVF